MLLLVLFIMAISVLSILFSKEKRPIKIQSIIYSGLISSLVSLFIYTLSFIHLDNTYHLILIGLTLVIIILAQSFKVIKALKKDRFEITYDIFQSFFIQLPLISIFVLLVRNFYSANAWLIVLAYMFISGLALLIKYFLRTKIRILTEILFFLVFATIPFIRSYPENTFIKLISVDSLEIQAKEALDLEYIDTVKINEESILAKNVYETVVLHDSLYYLDYTYDDVTLYRFYESETESIHELIMQFSTLGDDSYKFGEIVVYKDYLFFYTFDGLYFINDNEAVEMLPDKIDINRESFFKTALFEDNGDLLFEHSGVVYKFNLNTTSFQETSIESYIPEGWYITSVDLEYILLTKEDKFDNSFYDFYFDQIITSGGIVLEGNTDTVSYRNIYDLYTGYLSDMWYREDYQEAGPYTFDTVSNERGTIISYNNQNYTTHHYVTRKNLVTYRDEVYFLFNGLYKVVAYNNNFNPNNFKHFKSSIIYLPFTLLIPIPYGKMRKS